MQAIANWFHDIDPWFWASSGDPAPYVHNGGYGSLFAAVVVLAIVGFVLVLRRRRDDLWWRYVVVATLLAPIPAALTVDRHNAIRLAALPVLCVVLPCRARCVLVILSAHRSACRPRADPLRCSAFDQFLHKYQRVTRAPCPVRRCVNPLLRQAFQAGKTIYTDFTPRAQTQAHSRRRDATNSRIQILPGAGIPPRGSLVSACSSMRLRVQKDRDLAELHSATTVGPRPLFAASADFANSRRSLEGGVGDSNPRRILSEPAGLLSTMRGAGRPRGAQLRDWRAANGPALKTTNS